MKRVSHSYYVVMQDFGRKGREAVVDPEITRSGVVSRIVSGEYKNILFVHHIDGLYIYDCTSEIMKDAKALETSLSPADMVDAQRDHARALRNEVV